MFTYIGTDLDTTPVPILYASFFVQLCCSAAAAAFLTYEYFITFDKEVEYFWRRRLNWGSLFFLFNRYIPLVIKAIDMSGFMHMSDKVSTLSVGYYGLNLYYVNPYDLVQSCATLARAYRLIEPLFYLSCATFTGIRAWALSNRNQAFTTFILLLCFTPTIMDLVSYPWIQVINDPIFGCMNGSTIPGSLAESLLAIGRGPVILADLLVFVLTWHIAYKSGVLRQASDWLRPSFWQTFIRDGTVHFITLLILNTLRFCFSFRLITPVEVDPACYVILFTEPVTAILICRFLINIQDVNKQTILGYNTWLVDASLQPHTELRFADPCLRRRMSRSQSDSVLDHTIGTSVDSEIPKDVPVIHVASSESC